MEKENHKHPNTVDSNVRPIRYTQRPLYRAVAHSRSENNVSNNSPSPTLNSAHLNAQTDTSYNTANSSKLKRILRHTVRLLRSFLTSIYQQLKSLPWKKVLPTASLFVFLQFIVFHFYIASPDRILDSLDTSYQTAEKIEIDTRKTTLQLQAIRPYSVESPDVLDSLSALKQEVMNNSTVLPPEFITRYALKNTSSDNDPVISSLYLASDRLHLETLKQSTDDTAHLITDAQSLFALDIRENPDNYINNIGRIINSAKDIQDNNPAIKTSTLQRIYQQISDSAEQFRISKDYDNFNFQVNNVSSEIYKEIAVSWQAHSNQLSTDISTVRSSLEYLINNKN